MRAILCEEPGRLTLVDRDYLLLARLTAIKVITDEHRPTKTVRQAACEVDLFSRDSVAVWFQTDESAAYGKCSGVNISITRDGCESLSRPFDDFLIAPEKLTRLRINSDEPLVQELHVLLASAALHDNRRRITCLVTTRNRRFPDDRACVLVQCDDCRLRATRSNNHHVTVN